MNLRVKVGVLILCMAVMLGFSGCGNSSDKENNTSVEDSQGSKDQENEGSKEEENNKESSNQEDGNNNASNGAVNNTDNGSLPLTEKGILTEDRIKELVLEDANILPKDAFFIKVRMEKENGVSVYDVEFYAGDKEYDYTVDPVSGKILEREVERE